VSELTCASCCYKVTILSGTPQCNYEDIPRGHRAFINNVHERPAWCPVWIKSQLAEKDARIKELEMMLQAKEMDSTCEILNMCIAEQDTEIERLKKELGQHSGWLNVNEKITVELTQTGIDIYKQHKHEVAKRLSDCGALSYAQTSNVYEEKLNGNLLTDQAWQLMQIFGEYFVIGGEAPFIRMSLSRVDGGEQ
jgi:hypothetical protein